jgi:hypothetical protein
MPTTPVFQKKRGYWNACKLEVICLQFEEKNEEYYDEERENQRTNKSGYLVEILMITTLWAKIKPNGIRFQKCSCIQLYRKRYARELPQRN